MPLSFRPLNKFSKTAMRSIKNVACRRRRTPTRKVPAKIKLKGSGSPRSRIAGAAARTITFKSTFCCTTSKFSCGVGPNRRRLLQSCIIDGKLCRAIFFDVSTVKVEESFFQQIYINVVRSSSKGRFRLTPTFSPVTQSCTCSLNCSCLLLLPSMSYMYMEPPHHLKTLSHPSSIVESTLLLFPV